MPNGYVFQIDGEKNTEKCDFKWTTRFLYYLIYLKNIRDV